jgi:heterodisulfide reductase subunit C
MNPFVKQEIEVTVKRKETTKEQLQRVLTGIEDMHIDELVAEYCDKFNGCTNGCPLYSTSHYKGRNCLGNIVNISTKELRDALQNIK